MKLNGCQNHYWFSSSTYSSIYYWWMGRSKFFQWVYTTLTKCQPRRYIRIELIQKAAIIALATLFLHSYIDVIISSLNSPSFCICSHSCWMRASSVTFQYNYHVPTTSVVATKIMKPYRKYSRFLAVSFIYILKKATRPIMLAASLNGLNIFASPRSVRHIQKPRQMMAWSIGIQQQHFLTFIKLKLIKIK